MAKRKISKNQIIPKIAKILGRFRQIEFAYIYGSFLKQQDFEDIDIALKASPQIATARREKIETDICDKLYKEIKIRTQVTESAYEFGFWDIHWLDDLPLPLRFRIIQNGRLLIDRDIHKRFKFEADVLKEYLDFEPAYHQMIDQAMQRMYKTFYGSPS